MIIKLEKLFGEEIDCTPNQFAEFVETCLDLEDRTSNSSGHLVEAIVLHMRAYKTQLESFEIDSKEVLKALTNIGACAGALASFKDSCSSLEETLGNLGELLVKKNADYGNSSIKNGGLVGNYVRLSDKVSRLENLLKNKEDPNFEAIEDTFLDIVGYSVLGQIILFLTEEKLREK